MSMLWKVGGEGNLVKGSQAPLLCDVSLEIHCLQVLHHVLNTSNTYHMDYSSTKVNFVDPDWELTTADLIHEMAEEYRKAGINIPHLSLSSVKHKLDYNQFGNQSQEDQVVGKENNSDVTLGDHNTHEEHFSPNEKDDNLVPNYTCVCCDAKNSVCNKFVLFIKANYDNYIHDIAEVLSHVQPKRKYTKYICKQYHNILKSDKSPFGRDSNTCNDMCEYDEKYAEHNVSIHDYTCTCCHVVSNKRHLFIKFTEGKYDQHNVTESLQYQYVSPYSGEFIC